jgi:transcriptional regulator with XRE-family HTH domain
MKTLHQHLKANNISQRSFASRAGISRSIVSRLVSQSIKPGLDLAARIERETDGQVLAVSWVSKEPASEQQGRASSKMTGLPNKREFQDFASCNHNAARVLADKGNEVSND